MPQTKTCSAQLVVSESITYVPLDSLVVVYFYIHEGRIEFSTHKVYAIKNVLTNNYYCRIADDEKIPTSHYATHREFLENGWIFSYRVSTIVPVTFEEGEFSDWVSDFNQGFDYRFMPITEWESNKEKIISQIEPYVRLQDDIRNSGELSSEPPQSVRR